MSLRAWTCGLVAGIVMWAGIIIVGIVVWDALT